MPVLTEFATALEVFQGTSLARFGHGELAIMHGEDARFQKCDKRLADELWRIVDDSPCLVCMPHMRGNDGWQWDVFLRTYGVADSKRWYGSSFVWRTMPHPKGMKWGPAEPDAYGRVDEMEEELLANHTQPLLVSMGPTATVLSDRLARKGIWTVDIGNAVRFL